MGHACVYTCTYMCVCTYFCLSVDVLGCSCSCYFPMSYKPSKYDNAKSVQSLVFSLTSTSIILEPPHTEGGGRKGKDKEEGNN